MRMVLIGITLALSAACTSEVTFDHQSVLDTRTRGLVLEDDNRAQAGMVGNTCGVDVRSGGINEDVDVALDEDHVRDAVPGSVLVQGSDGLHVYEPGDWGWYTDGSGVAVPGGDLVDGAITDVGVVGLRNDCTVTWSGDLQGNTAVSGTDCAEGAVSVDRDTGTAYVATDGVVYAVTPDGADEIATGDLAVWDGAAEVVYVADLGGNELRAVEATGGLRWAAALDGQVVTLDAMGAVGAAAVMLEKANGAGELVVYDGFTGERTSSMDTPAPAPDVTTSASGRTLAVVLPDQTHFFRVRSL